MYEKDKLRSDIEQYITLDKVFTESDEKKVFEKISKLGNKKSRKIKTVMPKILSIIGVATLICIIAGIFLYQDILNDTNRNAEDTETIEKDPVKEESGVPTDSEENNVEEEQDPTTLSNEYDLFTIKVGDKVGEWTVIEKDNSPESFTAISYKIRFIGDQKITGTIKKQTVKHNDWPALEAYVFIPDDVLNLPYQKSSSNLPYIIANYEQEPSLMDLNLELGESIENVELRVKYIANIVNPEVKISYPSIGLYNEKDTDGNFQSDNAPDQLISSGVLFKKFMSDGPRSVVQFAEKTGGILYGIEGTENAFIWKDHEPILTFNLTNHSVDYEYIYEFKETILNEFWTDERYYADLLSDLDRFIQTGKRVTTTYYKIFDLDGNLHLEFTMF